VVHNTGQKSCDNHHSSDVVYWRRREYWSDCKRSWCQYEMVALPWLCHVVLKVAGKGESPPLLSPAWPSSQSPRSATGHFTMNAFSNELSLMLVIVVGASGVLWQQSHLRPRRVKAKRNHCHHGECVCLLGLQVYILFYICYTHTYAYVSLCHKTGLLSVCLSVTVSLCMSVSVCMYVC